MTWAIGCVLVALSCLISIRPALALTTAVGGGDTDTYQTSPFERSFSSQLFPSSAQATEPRRTEKRPAPETPLPEAAARNFTDTLRTGAIEERYQRPASRPHRSRFARGPPTGSDFFINF